MDFNELYKNIDFILGGGALKCLSDFLGTKNFHAIVIEKANSESQDSFNSFNIIDSVGIIPSSLTINFQDNNPAKIFPDAILKDSCELNYQDFSAEILGNKFQSVIRMRGLPEWEIFVLIQENIAKPESFIQELEPYAGLIRLWQTFKKISDTEKKLSRLSYMILATKNTLASIFEPMPLQYFASFLNDVIQESLFPKSIAILKDEGNYLTVLKGHSDSVKNIPERTGIFASQILPPNPVVLAQQDNNVEIVLPIAEGDFRLFCVIKWDRMPDSQTMNFLELLGNLAVRAVAINNLRKQSVQSKIDISSEEFTVLSLSNVLKILKGAESRGRFLSLLIDIFMEQCRMKNCLLAIWDKSRSGYTLSERRTGHFRSNSDPTLLPSAVPVKNSDVHESIYNLDEQSPDSVFKSWGLGGCPWKEILKASDMKYIFPLCDENSLVAIIAIGSGQNQSDYNVLNRAQLASMQLIAQFAAYEFRRFE